MMRGTKPQSNALKRLRGNPGMHRLNDREPQPPPLSGSSVPRELTPFPLAVAEWMYLVPMLRSCRLITSADRSVLMAYCLEWSHYLEATALIARDGIVVKSRRYRDPRPNPQLMQTQKALANCLRLWAELGLTPSSRSRVKVPEGFGPGPDGDRFTRFDVSAMSTLDVHPQ